MQITVDKVIDIRTYDPQYRVSVTEIPLDLILKKQRGEELTLQEFAVLALIEATTNA